MLNWLVGSGRPLSVEELAEAVAINPAQDWFDLTERLLDLEEIYDLCGSLIRKANSGIVLAHFSIKGYLVSNNFANRKTRLSNFALQ